MNITSKKCVEHHEEIIYHEVFDVRVKIKKGKIITLKVEVEDGEMQGWEGKSDNDKKVAEKFTGAENNYLDELLEKTQYE